ncbi:MAG: hypothetical protein K1X55_07855 [Chitinophagales bacterium]|nr:hypothetical protein [Chitinophagales bacterium]
MINSDLILLFNSLNDSEKRGIKKWISSPYHNQRKDLIDLFDYLLSRKNISAITVNRYRAWEAIYPKLPFHADNFRILCTFALKTLEKMLVFRQWEAEKVRYKKDLASVYEQRRLHRHALSYLHETEKQLRSSPLNNSDQFKQHAEIQTMLFRLKEKDNRDNDNNLQALEIKLTYFYMAEIIKYACIMATHQVVAKKEYTFTFLPEILEKCNTAPFCEIPAIRLYWLAYHFVQDNDAMDAYNEFMTLLPETITEFSSNEGRDLFLLGINFCIKRINRGDVDFRTKLFAIYQHAISIDILSEYGELSRFTFRNIISLSLQQKDYAWTEQFIQNNINKVNPDFREGQLKFNMARLYFEQKQYNKTLPLLFLDNYGDTLINLAAKTMLAKIYYETKEIELLNNSLDNFTVYLNRQKKIGYHADNYRNFIFILKKITKTNISNKKTAQALIAQIEETQPLTEKNWLIAQLTSRVNLGG